MRKLILSLLTILISTNSYATNRYSDLHPDYSQEEVLNRLLSDNNTLRSDDPYLGYAIKQIQSDFGDVVSVNAKAKRLLKFGRNQNVGNASTGYTVWFTGADQANETYVNTNAIDSVSSGNAGDTMIVTIEGHTVGDDLSVSSITQTGGTATCTTSSAHGYTTDDWVLISGANQAGYNGIVQITVTSTTAFTYTVDSSTESPATGTITSTNQNKTFVVQNATLNGQTRVALTTALARATRCYIAEQNKAASNSGLIYVYENTSLTSGKPTDTTKIHISVAATKGQSEKASTSISSQDYWILTGFRGSVLEKAASFADVELQVRRIGGVFRPLEDVGASDAHNGVYLFKPYAIIPKNADVRLVAISDSTSRDVSGSIQGYLAIVQ